MTIEVCVCILEAGDGYLQLLSKMRFDVGWRTELRVTILELCVPKVR